MRERMVVWLLCAGAIAAVSLAGCGGDDAAAEDVLASFDFGGCGEAASLSSGYDTADLDGLQCVVAKAPGEEDGSVAFVNFPAGCVPPDLLAEVPFAGEAMAKDDGTLSLSAVWQFESPNACGNCLYYFDFGLEPFEFEQPLDMELTIASCSAADCLGPPAAMSIGSDDDPALSCRYLLGTQGYGSLEDIQSGARYLMPTSAGACEAGLVAHSVETELEPSLELCLPTCEDLNDCPFPSIEVCDDGACVIETPLALL